MSDHERDDELRALARGYNAPPPVPREEMWERIRAALDAGDAGDAGGRAAGDEPRVLRLAPRSAAARRRVAPWLAAVAGLAATLLLGVVIGRRIERGADAGRPGQTLAVAGPTTHASPAESATAAATRQAPVPATPQVRLAAGGTAHGAPGVPAAPSARTTAQAETVRRELERHQQRMQQAARSDARGAAAAAPYEIATTHHLAQAEALLTAFHAEARSGQVDAHVTGWARDLLSTTRLLIDSPAAQDPRTARLLGDLELVLAQIADLPSTRDSFDLMLVDQAVERRNVMSRLRAALPAGT